MKLFNFKFLKVSCLFFISLASANISYGAVLIDNYNLERFCPFAPFPCDATSLNPGGIYQEFPNLSAGFGLLERDHTFRADAGNLEKVRTAARLPGLNMVGVFNVVGDQSLMNLVYDGNDTNSPIISFDKMNRDLTQGGLENVFRLRLATSTEVDIRITVYEDADTYSEYTGQIPNSQNTYKDVEILFDQFTHTDGGADFSSVKAIELELINLRSNAGNALTLAQLIVNASINDGTGTLLSPYVCNNSVPVCSVLHYGLTVDKFETRQQLTSSLEATLYDDASNNSCDEENAIGGDIDCDGDFDSTNDNGDTILYTVTLTNTDDLLDAPATGVVYRPNFTNLSVASFVEGTVTTSQGTVGDDGGVIVNVGTIEDGEEVIITYRVKIASGQLAVPNLTYSHNGSVVADEWSAYNLTTKTIQINKFNIEALMTASTGTGVADADAYSGPGERVTFTASIQNVGMNATQVDFFQGDIDLAALVAGTVSAPDGSVIKGNGGSDAAVHVRYAALAPGAIVSITFDMVVDDSFPFAEHDRISAQALVSNSSSLYFGLSDDPANVASAKDLTEMIVDAFPDRSEAHLDGDGDGLPENCNPACDDEDIKPNNTDNDDFPNDVDLDDDGDGVDDELDAFPFHCEASRDTDGDGMPDTLVFPINCRVQSAEASSFVEDDDDDNDGTLDEEDAFPLHKAADTDTDGDGKPDFWLASCNENCQEASRLVLDLDNDNDGVSDVIDAFNPSVYSLVDALSASVDADGDGFPDAWNVGCNQACQLASSLILDPSLNDTDNDGVINPNDKFPNDCSASLDTDSDGKPNRIHNPLAAGCVLGVLVEDDDDDNDGAFDVDDKFPLNAYASVDDDNDGRPEAWTVSLPAWVIGGSTCDSTETPVFSGGNVDDSGVSVCESRSNLTFDHFPNDFDNNGIPNDPGNDDADDDGDGIANGEDEDDSRDTNPPQVTPPADRTVLASGELSTVLLGFASAVDYVQGVLVSLPQNENYINASNLGPFAVGVHTIIWTATDDAGNIGTAIQIITVKENPDLNKNENKYGSSGGSFGILSIFALLLMLSSRRKIILQ